VGFLLEIATMFKVISIALVLLLASVLVVRFVGAFIAYGMGDHND
jgi:hypothetical protein